jgi:hypothetical protein
MLKEHFYCKIVKPRDRTFWNRCVRFEYDTFAASGYIDKNPEKKIPHYDQYDHSSFLAVYPEQKKRNEAKIPIAGIMRLFYAPHAHKMQEGLYPILDLYNRSGLYPDKLDILLNLDPRDTVNIGALALNEKFRSPDFFMKIMGAFYVFCCNNRYLYAFASLENFFLHETLKKYFTLIDVGPRLPFRGAPSILTIIDIFDQLIPSTKEQPAS